jgi:hypothetical protein
MSGRWSVRAPVLPDGLLSNQNANLGKFWRVLQWKMLVSLMDISPILLPLGIFFGHFGTFSPSWYVVPNKIWQPWPELKPMWPNVAKKSGNHAQSWKKVNTLFRNDDFFGSCLKHHCCFGLRARVARWFIFIPKIPIWVNLEALGMENIVIFFDHLE